MANKNQKSATAAAKVRAAQQQKRQRMQWSVGIIVLVVAGVIVLVLAKMSQPDNSSSSSLKPTSAPSSVVDDIAAVPLPNIVAAHAQRQKGDATFKGLLPATGKPLVQNGKPEVLYMGAEYCPYCGGERWALAVALSKFGTFSGLQIMHSAEDLIPTLSFSKATFTSKYLAFTPIELKDQQGKDLEKATPAQMALLSAQGGSFPYINFGGKFIQSGASLDVSVLKDMSQKKIAASLDGKGDLQSVPTQVNSAAGEFIKALCTLTKGQPGNVCKAFPT